MRHCEPVALTSGEVRGGVSIHRVQRQARVIGHAVVWVRAGSPEGSRRDTRRDAAQPARPAGYLLAAGRQKEAPHSQAEPIADRRGLAPHVLHGVVQR